MAGEKSPLRAILFDAYGTLLDVHSVIRLCDELFPGAGPELSAIWRDKQLQYTWLRTLSGRYADFGQVNGEALDYAAAMMNLAMTADARTKLLAAYETLTPFEDAPPALDALAKLGIPLAVLSNGTPGMLGAAFEHAGLIDRFAALLSVDTAGHFKTSPEAYRVALGEFGGTAAEFVLVSSNGWDIAGAAHFGFGTFWVNRKGAPVERLGVEPGGIGVSLADLAAWLAANYGV